MLSDDVIYRVFPARAGVSRSSLGRRVISASVPRASGGEPYGKFSKFRISKCSPRERG